MSLQQQISTLLQVYNYNEIVQCLQDTVKLHYRRATYNMEQLQKAPKPVEPTVEEEEQPEDEIPPPPEAIKTLEIKPKDDQKKRQPKRLTPI